MNDQAAVIKGYLKSQTGRLALTYLAIIICMTIIFSFVIFHIVTSRFDRPLPPQSISRFDILSSRQQLEELFQERANQARFSLIVSLIVLNLFSLLIGSILSHFLARKTLGPIESALESQKQFVSDASHELRTPLTALQTTNEVALRNKNLSLAEAKDLIGNNILETIKLRELTNSLLGLVKQEAASTVKEEIGIQDLVSDVMSRFVVVAQEKNISVEDKTLPVLVRANKNAVEQIVAILLDNAIKYSPSNSTVTLSTQHTNDELRLKVADEGMGIEKDQQSKIFDRFYRVDQSRSGVDAEGTGLGLSIAKAVCERQGMALSLKSTPDKGSTFTLHIKS